MGITEELQVKYLLQFLYSVYDSLVARPFDFMQTTL